LYPIIQNADFVVLPSLMDNFPNACIEAMYFGKVVIGTDGASFEQLIDNGVNGFLCKINDPQDLLCKMNGAASLNANEKRKMCEKAHERITLLRPEIVVKKLLRFYQYVIESSKNSWNRKV
jgi:glycosyltransferase involved in cell wall biosynthesis